MRLRLQLIRTRLAVNRLSKGMTLGVRGAVFDADGKVLLVRHSYLPGWYLPGGGVEPGETAGEALARELREEGGIRLEDAGDLFGLYLNRAVSARDHVALYVCRRWTQAAPRRRSLEIAEARFAPPEALPEGTTGGTVRRLAEILGGVPRSADW